MPIVFSESSCSFKAILIRATAAFLYLIVFSVIPHHWYTFLLMWFGLVVIKWIDSIYPFYPVVKNECSSLQKR